MMLIQAVNRHLMGQFKASNQLLCRSVRPMVATMQRPASSKFDQYLENQFPRFYEHYQVAVKGGKWCWSDLKIYYRVRKALWKKQKTEADLSVSELIVLIQSKRVDAACHNFLFTSISRHWRSHHNNRKIQLARVLPLVFVALVVPGGLPSIVLAMIVYPLVLTRHFWSPVVTRVYQTTEAGRNARYLYPRIIQHLEQSSGKPDQFKTLPVPIEQLNKMDLPALEQTTLSHQLLLKRLHKLPLLSSTSPLIKHAELLKLLDKKFADDRGLIDAMNRSELELQFHLRRLNYEFRDVESMRSLLNKWLDHAPDLPPSIYLHAAVLIQARREEFFKKPALDLTNSITKVTGKMQKRFDR